MKTLCDERYLLTSRITIARAFISRWEKIRQTHGLCNRSEKSLHSLRSAACITDTGASPDDVIS